MKKELVILIGNIGTGKTTYVKEYQEKGYVVIARDQIRYGIGNGKYIFNYDYEPTIWKTELYMYKEFIKLGINIIVDEVGINSKMRKRYIPYAKKYGYKITAIVMPHLCMGEAVNRRMIDPHGQPNVKLWQLIWTKFEALYEDPTKKEGFDTITFIEETR